MELTVVCDNVVGRSLYKMGRVKINFAAVFRDGAVLVPFFSFLVSRFFSLTMIIHQLACAETLISIDR